MVERPTVKPQRLIENDATDADPWIGRQIAGRYRILSALGEGGMGTIYLAEHLTLGRKVALKVLIAELAGKEAIRRRFDREAKTLSTLHHPNVVAVNDYGVDDDTPFLVMELAPGDDLSKALDGNRPTPAQAYEVFRQLLRGVAHAHAEGLVHRDLKPSNVMVRFMRDGSLHVQVLDFGLARFEDDDVRGGPQLTRAGAILGTPAYMAPEQAAGESATPSSDTYSAGLILFEMLAGRRPFAHREPTALLRAHLMEEPPPLARLAGHLTVPPELEAFLRRALAKSRVDRFADAAEMLRAFETLPVPVDRSSNPSPGMSAPPPAMTIPSGKHAVQTLTDVGRSIPLPVWLGVGGLGVAGAILFVLLIDWNGDPPSSMVPPAVAPTAQPSALPAPAPPRNPGEARMAQRPTEPSPAAEAARPTAEAPPAEPAAGWQGDVPPELRAAHARLARSDRRLPRSMEGSLLRYARSHPQDPRPHLLLGRSYGNGRALSDMVGEYGEALDLSPSVKADSVMQAHLLEASIANTSRLRSAARRIIGRHYSEAEIRPAVERQMARANADERSRLQEVLSSL